VEKILCLECGASVVESARFCGKCGAQLPGSDESPTAPAAPSAAKKVPWLLIGVIAALLMGLVLVCAAGGALVYWTIQKTAPEISREVSEEKTPESRATATPKAIPTPTPRATPTPTPDYSDLKVGEIAATEQWAVSVVDIEALSGGRFVIRYRLKNLSYDTQYFILAGMPVQLLDKDGYTIEAIHNTMLSPPRPIFIPPRMTFLDSVILDAKGQDLAPAKVVVSKEFVGSEITFNLEGGGEPQPLPSEETLAGVGDIVPFGNLQVQLLSVSPEKQAEVGLINEGSSEVEIEWGSAVWLDFSPSIFGSGKARVILAVLVNAEGRLCPVNEGDQLPTKVPAGGKSRGYTTLRCGKEFGQATKLFLFDGNAHTAVFDLSQ